MTTHSIVLDVAAAKDEQRAARAELLTNCAQFEAASELHPDALRLFVSAVAEYLCSEIALEDREAEARASGTFRALQLLKTVRG